MGLCWNWLCQFLRESHPLASRISDSQKGGCPPLDPEGFWGNEDMKLVLATRNRGKVKEMAGMLASYGIEVLSLDDFPQVGEIEESGATFVENAIIKAKETMELTSMAALADDSGLEVDYLNGAPGVYSARFAGTPSNDQNNNDKLLTLLANVPTDKRTARFQCVIAIAYPDGQIHTFQGTCEGLIAETPQGTLGFGYDPLFYLPEHNKTFGELDLLLKNKISHRGQALSKALAFLAQNSPRNKF